jgi:hypothetical protein
VVEDRVSSQVNRIVFFGLNGQGWFNKLRGAGQYVLSALGPLAGGSLPDVFSADRMDGSGSQRGPITILPPEKADVSWAPSQCEVRGRMQACSNQRAGDLYASGTGPAFFDDTQSLGKNVDRTRFTLPYRINTQYWTQSGGTSSGDDTGKSANLAKPAAKLTSTNDYVSSYKCRGHYFDGSQRAQETTQKNRYGPGCFK